MTALKTLDRNWSIHKFIEVNFSKLIKHTDGHQTAHYNGTLTAH